ncbi:MAG: hypothetical protein K5739_03960 [Lachnospiraceae bacterium]|nr:hypothetical protein [Lachnospiraceae bacterium]
MKDKIRFFLNCIGMLLLLGLFCFGVVMPQYTGNYQAAMIDKVNALKNTEGARIVLIGNSNLAYGVNSEMLEKTLGKPVINMGLHGGTGNCFNEQAALLHVHPGDLYVICETNYDDNDRIKNPELVWVTIEDHFQLYPLIRAKDWPDMLEAYPTYLGKCITMWRQGTGNGELNNSYRRSAFNRYGDNYYPRKDPEPEIDFGPVRINNISEPAEKRLNNLYRTLREKGADMVIAAYPIPLCENVPSPEEYSAFAKDLSDKLDAEVISDFNNYRYDPEYFYDTYAHLTDTGVYVRTNQLIADLSAYLAAGDASDEK